MAESRTFRAGVLASGQVLGAIVSLLTYAALSRILSEADYATYRKTFFALSFAAPLLMLGLPHALYYFLPVERERGRGVLIENLLLLAGMGAVFWLVLVCGGNRLLARWLQDKALRDTLLWIAPYPLLMLPVAATAACLMSRGQARELAAFNVARRVLAFALIVWAAYAWGTTDAALIGMVTAGAVALAGALVLMRRATRGEGSQVTLGGMRAQIHYSVPLGLAGMLGTISWAVDKAVVAAMCSHEAFGVYANGAFEVPLISIVTGSVTAVLLPDLTRYYRGGQRAEALALWKRSAAKCALVLFPAMCALFFLAPELMAVLFSSKYRASGTPFRFYLLVLPIRIVTFTAMLKAAGRSGSVLVTSAVGVVVNIALSILLVRYVGYIGAVIGTVLMIYLWTVPFFLLTIVRTYGGGWRGVLPWRTLIRIMGIAMACSVIFLPKAYLVKRLGDLPCVAVLGGAYVALVVFALRAAGLVDVAAAWRALAGALTRRGRGE